MNAIMVSAFVYVVPCYTAICGSGQICKNHESYAPLKLWNTKWYYKPLEKPFISICCLVTSTKEPCSTYIAAQKTIVWHTIWFRPLNHSMRRDGPVPVTCNGKDIIMCKYYFFSIVIYASVLLNYNLMHSHCCTLPYDHNFAAQSLMY